MESTNVSFLDFQGFYDTPQPQPLILYHCLKVWPADAWKAAPVKSGSLVLIHGQVSLDHDDNDPPVFVLNHQDEVDQPVLV